MNDYKKIVTSAEVWAVIRARHPDLVVFGSYSAPDGDRFGNPLQGVMLTSYGFKEADYPIIEARTTWYIDICEPFKRLNEQHEYWLCIATKQDE